MVVPDPFRSTRVRNFDGGGTPDGFGAVVVLDRLRAPVNDDVRRAGVDAVVRDRGRLELVRERAYLAQIVVGLDRVAGTSGEDR
ncbi:hypothetical protein DMP23_39075 [Amycolatopsis sp. A1MSW2902]